MRTGHTGRYGYCLTRAGVMLARLGAYKDTDGMCLGMGYRGCCRRRPRVGDDYYCSYHTGEPR